MREEEVLAGGLDITQSVVDEPVPDGVPCPENVIRGQVMC